MLCTWIPVTYKTLLGTKLDNNKLIFIRKDKKEEGFIYILKGGFIHGLCVVSSLLACSDGGVRGVGRYQSSNGVEPSHLSVEIGH